MHLALQAAWEYQGLAYPNPGVGAVITLNGKLLSIAAHEKSGSSHAEVLALLGAYEFISGKAINFDRQNALLAHQFLRSLSRDFFKDCAAYVTLEPCNHTGKTTSCATLLIDLKIKSVYIATLDPVLSHSGGAKRLQDNGINVHIGLLQQEANELIEPFSIWQKRAFVLFKLAQTTNGKITDGVISSLDSRIHTHKLRSVASKLAIGGNTVRVDRPTLDCRLTGTKAPDILIYTANEESIDKSIPLFDVPNRDVALGDNLDFLRKPSFILVEGGEGMLRAWQDKIDWLLIYQAPMLNSKRLSYNIDMELKTLHHQNIGDDLIIWSKKI